MRGQSSLAALATRPWSRTVHRFYTRGTLERIAPGGAGKGVRYGKAFRSSNAIIVVRRAEREFAPKCLRFGPDGTLWCRRDVPGDNLL
jgi:hypothetical protein